MRFIMNRDRLIVSRLAAQVGAQTLADGGISWLDSKGIRVL